MNRPPWFRTAVVVAMLAGLGAVALPVAAYVLFRRLLGPYEGVFGLTDYLGSIYAGAGQAHPGALAIVLAPLAVLLLWLLILRLGRRWAGADQVPSGQ